MEFNSIRLQANGIEMHVVIEGQGPEVLLLHGFPDSHAIWRYQIPALVAAGYRVIAPDLRGCGQTDMPPKVADYRRHKIVADVVALLDTLGIEQVRVVGHDWGAVIGWQLALTHPERVERYAALSVGHPSSYATAGIRQKLKAYYIALFLIRGLAEWALRQFNWAVLSGLTRCRHEMAHWRATLAPAGRLTAALNYYRANLDLVVSQRFGFVDVPVLGVYSSNDIALLESQMTRSATFCRAGWRYARLDGVGHWMPSEAPEKLNPILLDFLR